MHLPCPGIRKEVMKTITTMNVTRLIPTIFTMNVSWDLGVIQIDNQHCKQTSNRQKNEKELDADREQTIATYDICDSRNQNRKHETEEHQSKREPFFRDHDDVHDSRNNQMNQVFKSATTAICLAQSSISKSQKCPENEYTAPRERECRDKRCSQDHSNRHLNR